MVNLFDLLTTTGNKITNASNTLFDKLRPDSTPQLDTIQLADDSNVDAAQSLRLQNGIKPLTPKERLFGRTLEENIQTINPEINSAEMTTIRDYRPGLFSDIASGYNENRNNAISMNNFGNNTLSDGRRKGFAYRLGEGLGSLARIGDSPLGRSLLIGGLVGATGGSGLDALAYGAQTGMLNQSNRLRDQAYRNSLEDQGLDTSNLRGYMTDSTYKNILDAKTLQDNAAWRKMYFDAQQQQNEISRILAQEKFNYQKQQDARENALKSRGLDIQEERYGNQEKKNQKISNDIASVNAIEQQLNQFSSMFKDMPGKFESNTIGNLRSWTGFQSPQQAEFESRKNLLFNKIARDLGGEKGVLSDQDIARVKEAMPLYTDSLEQKQAKMNAIYDLLAIAKNKAIYSAPNASTSYNSTDDNDPLGLGL